MRQRQQPMFRPEIDASQFGASTAKSHLRFRRRFFIALFIALLGLTGFLVVLAVAIHGS
ncbi:MAG: hypothetical protein WAU00_04425 [Caldilinea sp.]|uniref:hypothetical protein n=1 Tax=Caldilinea sp. TaxID=2293560 RepID=UPI002CD012FB|nr:hypothetical protein [Anaerolineales bacterium]HQY90380.1 hypothetical protein [Caldilinea sp.]HRA65390.1 hypothetical protein [Caldilinea sp.]